MRRQVHAAGVRIAQHAREAIDVVDDSPTPPVYATVAAAVEKLGPVLDTIERHLQHLADRLDHPQATGAGPPGATAAQRDAETTIGTGRVPAELPVPAELHHAELAVLGACLVAPGVRRTALSILVPADFTTPQVAATWTALTALAARGDPIDFVLLAAAVARHDTTTGGVPGLAPAELFRLAERGDPGIGARAVQTVARACPAPGHGRRAAPARRRRGGPHPGRRAGHPGRAIKPSTRPGHRAPSARRGRDDARRGRDDAAAAAVGTRGGHTDQHRPHRPTPRQAGHVLCDHRPRPHSFQRTVTDDPHTRPPFPPLWSRTCRPAGWPRSAGCPGSARPSWRGSSPFSR